MTAFDELLRRNDLFAHSSDSDALATMTPMPKHRVFVVTCLDPRVEPAAFLGISPGDAVVLRNPGGRVTDSTITDISLISFMGEAMSVEGPPMEVAVVHHTQCGMGLLANPDFRHGFAERSGLSVAELAAWAVTDPQASVRHDVDRLLASPLTSARLVVSGHVLDLATGLVTTVVPAGLPRPAAAGTA
jgi:carbonic anhydrase